MKRIIAEVVLFVLLGLVTSVAIAWLAVSMYAGDGTVWRMKRTSERERFSLEVIRGLAPAPPASETIELVAGWPMPCVMYEHRREAPVFRRSWEYESRGAVLGTNPMAGSGAYRDEVTALPFRPMPLGLLADVVVCGGLWRIVLRLSVLPLVPFVLRAAARRRRGACAKCGYDLRLVSSERCPECGTDRTWRPMLPRHTSLIAPGLAAGVLIAALCAYGAWFAANPPWPPLLHAAYHDDVATARRMLKAGADVHAAAPRGGFTALHAASAGAGEAMIRLLVEAGANVNGAMPGGMMPLHTAVAASNVQAAAALLEAGADLDAPTWGRSKLTPVKATALRTRDIELLRLLAHAGANLDADPRTGSDSVLGILVKSSSLSDYRHRGRGFLYAREAIALGVSITHDLLVAVINRKDHEFLRLLEEHGANLAGRDADGSTLLWHVPAWSASSGDQIQAIIDLILDRGVDINARNDIGRTALADAVGNSAVVESLLERGADPNIADNAGEAPLDLATKPGSGERTVRLLLEHGADPRVLRSDGSLRFETMPDWWRKPIEAAAVGRHLAPTWTPLHWAAYYDDLDAVRRILLTEPDLEFAQPPSLETPLMVAAIQGGGEMIHVLLDAGADVTARSTQGRSALHVAAEAPNLEAASVLIAAGSDVNAAEDAGFTPAMLAVIRANDVSMLRLLAHAGAKLDSDPRAAGYSVVDAAVDFGRDECAREALSLGGSVTPRGVRAAVVRGNLEMPAPVRRARRRPRAAGSAPCNSASPSRLGRGAG